MSTNGLTSVTIPANGTITITIPVTPILVGSLVNPKSGGTCAVDPSNKVAESNESNNTCSDTVTVASNLVNTTTSITSKTPNPSVVGQPYAVSVSVAAASGSSSPTGTVKISDGSATCTGSLSGTGGTATASCDLTSTPARIAHRDLQGDTNFNTTLQQVSPI